MMTCFQIQAKVIAVIEMVLSIIFLSLIGFAILLVSTQRDEILENLKGDNHDEEYPHMKELLESPTMQQVSVFMVPVIYFLVEFGLAVFLYRSAEKRNAAYLRTYFTISVTLTLVGVVAYIVEIMRIPEFASTSSIFVVNFTFTMYSLWVVYQLIAEIKSNGYHQPVVYNSAAFKL